MEPFLFKKVIGTLVNLNLLFFFPFGYLIKGVLGPMRESAHAERGGPRMWDWTRGNWTGWEMVLLTFGAIGFHANLIWICLIILTRNVLCARRMNFAIYTQTYTYTDALNQGKKNERFAKFSSNLSILNYLLGGQNNWSKTNWKINKKKKNCQLNQMSRDCLKTSNPYHF